MLQEKMTDAVYAARKNVVYDTREAAITFFEKYCNSDEYKHLVSDVIASENVEKLLIGFPVEIIYVKWSEETRELIKGTKMIVSLIAFFNNEMPLKGMKILKEFEGCFFKDLPAHLKRKLTETYWFRFVTFEKLPEVYENELKKLESI